MARKKISVVIPVYNENHNVTELVERLEQVLPFPFELIFVDDHSTDGTYEKLLRLQNDNRLSVYLKQGKKGKSFSLIEGFAHATGDILVMIDADLQYPPEAIPEMVQKLQHADLVITNRRSNHAPVLRKLMSRVFRFFFAKALFGLSYDIQSGLKAFKKEVYETLTFTPSSPWAFDLEFIHNALHAGYKIAEQDIIFAPRSGDTSKVSFVQSSIELAFNAIKTRCKRIVPFHTKGNGHPMRGAGIRYKKKQYVTHTTLPHHKSAIQTFYPQQKVFFTVLLLLLVISLFAQPLLTLQIVVAVLSFIYFIDVLFNLSIILKSLYTEQEITIDEAELDCLQDAILPVYSILCPLYKEAHVIPQFLQAISKLDWPKEKLDVMLLLEEDDIQTIQAAQQMDLPFYVRIVVVPDSQPKTKPKACNYGLTLAKGEYLVIYDAEDMPDPLQLKKAYLGFHKTPDEVICLQAKLNYYNPQQNVLTRFFTAEYSLWFDVTLTGMQSLSTSLPLGGTSNHFKVKDLQGLEGWDPFNVTEDADLGIRLFKAGYKTAIIESTTLEEANSKVKNWLRQRSRWIKGYMQTYLVHMRDIGTFVRTQGIHAFYFQLTVGGKLAFILINPFLWVATIAYFALYAYVGPTIESLYPAWVLYMAVISLVFGNFLFLYYYMIGCAKRGQWDLLKYVFLIPVYWLMTSIAGFIAFYQLLFKPHYWEKTIHGLHLKQAQDPEQTAVSAPQAAPAMAVPTKRTKRWISVPELIKQGRIAYTAGGALVIAAVVSNLLNFIFNAYLGRVIDIDYYAEVSLVSSFLYLINIPVSALSATVKFRSGFLTGRYGSESSYEFWRMLRLKVCLAGVAIAFIWVAYSVFLQRFFHTSSILPFVLFAPYFVATFVAAVDSGYLSGKLLFTSLALITITEPILKLAIGLASVTFHFTEYAYIAIPFSTVGSFLLGWVLVKRYKAPGPHQASKHEVTYLPKKFFFASGISGLSTMSFLSLDILLANHYLSKTDAGIYALIALAGKMIYFLGNLATQFVTPFVSRNEGANKNSRKTLQWILLATTLLSFVGFIGFGIFAQYTLPLLFGERAKAIIPYILVYAFAMFCFTISRVFSSYYLVKRIYFFSAVGFLLTVLQFVLVSVHHQAVSSIVFAMFLVGTLNLALMVLLHLNVDYVKHIERMISDFFGLFKKSPPLPTDNSGQAKILIFNWRDTHHKWSGGAETYIHELAKRWVKNGNSVTLFCGNDGSSPHTQVVDGVYVIRRGGAYLVYLWAFIYYIFKFRGKYDVIIDCENGIPFFTPLYVRKPILLLIHHVHQDVFREHLVFPLSSIARFLEGRAMPYVYRHLQVITVSESSQDELVKQHLAQRDKITVIHNGTSTPPAIPIKKTAAPSFAYLGRLKPYKNIDVAIKAFAAIYKNHPKAKLAIIGDGESKRKLMKLVKKLKLTSAVTFYGKVSEKQKYTLLASSWAALQPSMAEGWGITVIEANAVGTPVIASNVNGLKDSVIDTKTGVLVKLRDIVSFAKEMEKIVSDTAYRQQLSENAYQWSQNFSWDKSAQRFFSILMHMKGVSLIPKNVFVSEQS